MSDNDELLEDDLRTMLRRRARDVSDHAEKTPTSDTPLDWRGVPESHEVDGRVRRLAAVAAVLVVAIAGTVVAVQWSDDSVEVGSDASSLPMEALPEWFDSESAPPVFTTGFDNPGVAADEYLRSRLPDQLSIGISIVDVAVDDEFASASWAVPDDPDFPYAGEVLLRRDDGSWQVIASTTDGVALSDVRRADGRLVGIVTDSGIDLLALDVLTLDGEPIDAAPYPDGYPGSTYRFGTAGTTDSDEIAVDLPVKDDAVVVRAQYVGGTLLSIAEVVVPAESRTDHTVQLSAPEFGVAFELPHGWELRSTDVFTFVGPDGTELAPDWTTDPVSEGSDVRTPAGNARITDVEGGLRIQIEIPCSWPACRDLDIYAYGLGQGVLAEQRLLDLVDGIQVTGPRIDGVLSDGRKWTVQQDFDRGLCVTIASTSVGCDDSGSVVSRDAPASTPRIASIDLPDGQSGELLYGFVPFPPFRPSDAPLVRLDYTDGRQSTGNITADPRTGLWATQLSSGDLPASVAYLDENGQVIETRELGG